MGFGEEIDEDGFELGVHGDAKKFLMIQYDVAHGILDLLESWWAIVRAFYGGFVLGDVSEKGLTKDTGNVVEVFDEWPEWFWSCCHLGVVQRLSACLGRVLGDGFATLGLGGDGDYW